MLKRTLFVSLVVAGLAAPAFVDAQNRGTAQLSVGGKNVSVDYGRPSLAGRDMLARAQVGSEWRLGADSPTSLKTEADLDFGGTKVAAGNYVLRARRDAEDKWTLLVRQGDQAVAEVPLSQTALDESVETLTIDLKEKEGGGKLVISWGKSALWAKFSAAK